MPKFVVKFGPGYAKMVKLPERVLGGLKAGVARLARRLMLRSKLPLEPKGLDLKPRAKVQGRYILARARITRGRLARVGLGRMPMVRAPMSGTPSAWATQRLKDGRQVVGLNTDAGFKPMYLRRRRLDWAGTAAASKASERRRVLVAELTRGLRK